VVAVCKQVFANLYQFRVNELMAFRPYVKNNLRLTLVALLHSCGACSSIRVKGGNSGTLSNFVDS